MRTFLEPWQLSIRLFRWTFDVQTERAALESNEPIEAKPEKELQREIQAVLRQVTASSSFLPLLEHPCSFDLLIYTAPTTETPVQWEESPPMHIDRRQEVRLRHFSTKVHRVDTAVAYRLQD